MLLLALALVLGGCGSSGKSSTGASTSTTATTAPTSATGPEGVPVAQGPPLAPASSTAPGTTVAGIHCGQSEQLVYHVHAHLAVFVNGQPRLIPAGIGIVNGTATNTPAGPFVASGSCFYWLHTHANDGILHIESPKKAIYTLGNFFDEWQQPLTGTQVASEPGVVTAFVNGRPWKGDPRQIRLLPREAIQLDVGSPAVPFQAPASWGNIVR